MPATPRVGQALAKEEQRRLTEESQLAKERRLAEESQLAEERRLVEEQRQPAVGQPAAGQQAERRQPATGDGALVRRSTSSSGSTLVPHQGPATAGTERLFMAYRKDFLAYSTGAMEKLNAMERSIVVSVLTF
jgi:hypothetical protein